MITIMKEINGYIIEKLKLKNTSANDLGNTLYAVFMCDSDVYLFITNKHNNVEAFTRYINKKMTIFGKVEHLEIFVDLDTAKEYELKLLNSMK